VLIKHTDNLTFASTFLIIIILYYIIKLLIRWVSSDSCPLPTSQVQVFSSEPCFHTFSGCGSSLNVTDEDSHQQHSELQLFMFHSLYFWTADRMTSLRDPEGKGTKYSPNVYVIWPFSVVKKYLNFAIFSNDLFARLRLWFCSAAWRQDINIRLSIPCVYFRTDLLNGS
jgi:hypothetical protein